MKNFFPTRPTARNPLYIGIVEDNFDPTHNYRIKIRINGVHNDLIKTEQLPWAAKLDTSFMGVNEDNDIKHSVPEKGSKVLVLAINSNLNSLVYLGSLYKNTANTPQDNKYLETYGIYKSNGQFIGFDKIQKFFQFLYDGTINIDRVLDINTNVKNTINTKCTTYNLEDQTTSIKGTTLNVNAQTINTTASDYNITLSNALNLNANLAVNINTGASTNITSPLVSINGAVMISTGASGIFIAGGQTVTVVGGIITNIS